MTDNDPKPTNAQPYSRRDFLAGATAVTAMAAAGGGVWWWATRAGADENAVFIGRTQTYNDELVALIKSGLSEVGIAQSQIAGKRVMLKPNLVETAPGNQHINTHPEFVAAVAETFRQLDAKEVFAAEGQGHRRDSWLVLEESGMAQALTARNIEFIDLNHDDLIARPNAGGNTNFTELVFPKSIDRADLIVSLPKMKTHHWAGVTCSMKNLFGVMPGIRYGWPKNPLHVAGIPNSIVDIYATLKPHIAIVDGIIAMEGDGPIMGTPKQVGAVVIGRNYPAVDATVARIMKLDPTQIDYLDLAVAGKLGPILENQIRQVGEPIDAVATPFDLLDLPHLQKLRPQA
jgi:uncharacterized protein (DUF362 family)